MKSDMFWFDNPGILISKDRLIEFVPTADMTLNERLNAISRLAIYSGTLLMLIYKNFNMFYIALITLTLLYLIREHFPDFLNQSAGAVNPELEHMEGKLQLPTENNPFMNVLITDYTQNPDKKPAADIDNPYVKKAVEAEFNKGLNRDVDDIWEKENSQRQFYSTPATTIPNDRSSFVNWCYSTPYSCKDGNLSNCIYDQRELSVKEITNGPNGPMPFNREPAKEFNPTN
jgi:hypothetical protein